jgi:hypothetical protein
MKRNVLVAIAGAVGGIGGTLGVLLLLVGRPDEEERRARARR